MKEDHRSYRRNFCSCEREPEKKIQACTGFEPLTSAIPVYNEPRVYNELNQFNDLLPAGLLAQIGKSAAPVSQRSWVRIPYKPEFFSGFLFSTAKVASITAVIFSHNCFLLLISGGA